MNIFGIQLVITTALSTNIQNGCQSIKSTNVCAPWSSNDLYIDTITLSKVYSHPKQSIFSVDDWEKHVLETTSGGPIQQSMWRNWVQCSGYKGEHIQYHRSYVCLTDIFVLSTRCNSHQLNITPLCSDSCNHYGNALQSMITNRDICPPVSNSHIKPDIDKRRSVLLQATSSCRQLSHMNFFDSNSTCMNGVQSDYESCGFGGHVNLGANFCTQNPNTSCCNHLVKDTRQEANASLISMFQRTMMIWEVPSQQQSDDTTQNIQFFSSPLFFIGLVSVGIIIIGIVGIVIFHKPVKPKSKKLTQSRASIDSINERVKEMIKEFIPGNQYLALYDYEKVLEDELDLFIGDILIVNTMNDDGWGDSHNMTRKTKGKVCLSFLEPL